MEQFYEQFKDCIQKEVPYCQSKCPFHIDIIDFVEKTGRGAFDAAYRSYKNAVMFPAIVAALCSEPCKEVCPRALEAGGGNAIQIRAIERTVVANTTNKEPHDYNVPKKVGKVAIIGGGISGLACASRLAARKYDVEIFEASDRIGGHLWNIADGSLEVGGLTPDIFIEDIELQLKHENYALHLNTKINSLNELIEKEFDAIYISTGKGGEDFGILDGEKNCALFGNVVCFVGGSLIGKDSIGAIADGLNISTAIEGFFKTNNMIFPIENKVTQVILDDFKLNDVPGNAPDKNGIFTKDEASNEAERCLRCQCDSCKIYCDLLAYSGKWPLRIKDEIQATLQQGSADLKPKPAKRLINTCTHCGICKDICPAHIDLDNMFLEARNMMHKLDILPWAFHDFWIRDMNQANSEEASIIKTPNELKTSKYAFFPGCQLGASDPRYVIDTYKWLTSKEPDMSMFLQCCGTPVKWAGNEEAHLEAISQLRTNWQKLGKPKLILACPTCINDFNEFLPEIEKISLYEYMADKGVAIPKANLDSRKWSVFDPCSSKDKDGLRRTIRIFAKDGGFKLESLKIQEENSSCCSYGGQVATSNPDYAKFVVNRRITESENPYITYCINCRDAFLGAGKETIHILDVIFNSGDMNVHASLPTATERRLNRVNLKKQLLKEYWGYEMKDEDIKSNLKVLINKELKEKLNVERILEEEIVNVIEFCEKTGRKIYIKEKGTVSGYRQVGLMTYWVEYKILDGNVFELTNAYCHRMKIELEAVWNGTKTNIDV